MKPFVRHLAFALALALPGGLVGACAAPPAAPRAAADRASIQVTAALQAPPRRALQQLQIPKPGGGRRTPVLTADDVDHVVVRLYRVEGATETLVATMDLPGAHLASPATFSRLRGNATYRLKARAYDEPGEDPNALISKDASSTVDVSTGMDDRPSWARVPVQLADLWMDASASTPFEGAGVDILAGTLRDGLRGLYLPFVGLLGANDTQNGQGPQAEFRAPFGIAAGSNGDIFVAEFGADLIRRVSDQGVVTTVPFNPLDPYAMPLDNPSGIDVVGSNYLYVADTANNLVREIDADTGDAYVIAGDAPLGVPTAGDADGDVNALPPQPSYLDAPGAVALIGEHDLALGGLMIADTGNHKLRHVAIDNDYQVTTVIDETGGLNTPMGMALVYDRYMFVADRGNHRVVRVDLSNEAFAETSSFRVEHVAGDGETFQSGYADGPGLDARFSSPQALAWAAPYLYVLDIGNHRIRRIEPDNEVDQVETVLDLNAAGLAGAFGSYGGLAWVAQSLVVADTNNDVLRRVR